MNDQDFMRITRQAFKPFLRQLGFRMSRPAISGNHYLAKFKTRRNAIWVSYEPFDDYLSVHLFTRRFARLSDIDDPVRSPGLHDLNERYMPAVSREERECNDRFFEGIATDDKAAHQLLKAAKELRLVLPRYLQSSQYRD